MARFDFTWRLLMLGTCMGICVLLTEAVSHVREICERTQRMHQILCEQHGIRQPHSENPELAKAKLTHVEMRADMQQF